jgi:NADPH-dependent glutamate synthase beta subunit-like oxidoreductase/ferredoxin
VPEYIRLIAQGRYTESYLLNRESNVFPGILGRTCDRPCEPACRRGRVDGKPVAICRLKRVAADHRDDVSAFLPKAPHEKNGKRVALIGAGPASLTVANDLMPLGYEVVIFEKLAEPGGLMRINIPSFRLPAQVLDEEVGYILDMGVDIRYNSPVTSMKALLDEPWDAVFVGSGAPTGKDLDIPGRRDASANIHIGIEWLASAHFGHIDRIGTRVLIIGVGNTAMDCCRTSRRIGGTDVKVIARRSRPHFKASPWELEDAEEEGVEIVENHAPKRFVLENGKLVGLELERLRWFEENGKQKSEVIDTVVLPCDDVILAIGQENAFPWVERDIGIEFDKWNMPVVDRTTMQSTRSGVFFGGDAAWGPENIIWAVAHGHEAAISIHNHCQGVALGERPPQGMNLISSKVGMHAWSYSNDYSALPRTKMQHAELTHRFSSLGVEVELGFTPEQTAKEVERCLNCDVQTHFTSSLCIECDACIDVCPVNCLTITPDAEDDTALRLALSAPAVNAKQEIFSSEPLPQTKRIMVKDEDVCLHCGLCAERCPTAAWDMRQFELVLPYAGSRVEGRGVRVEKRLDGDVPKAVQHV